MTTRARMTSRARRAVPALLLLTAACSVPAPAPSPTAQATAPPPLPPITVGSGPSVELQLMSELYAQVLEASGYEVTRSAPSPDGAAALESLRGGEVDLAASVVTELVAASGAEPSPDLDRLRALLDGEGLRLLQPSGAERALGVAMRREDADQAGIATVSGLVAAGGEVTWGLPGDCAALAECAGLAAAYGLALDQLSVVPVPMCAPESGTALNDGVADASIVCTTQPEIERLNLLVLEDDRGALPAGTIAPVVRAEWLDAAPTEFDEVIDSISAAIDTHTLTSLGVQVALEERPVADVAREWLEDNGLI